MASLHPSLPVGLTTRERAVPALLLIGMGVVALLPFMVVQLPSMTDLPGHIGRYHVMMELAHSELLQRYYAFDWHLVGNLGVDLLVRALAPLLGVEAAARFVVAGIPLLSLLGIAAVSRALHGRIEPAAAVAGCFVFSNPFLFGFVNFCLAAALALLAFAAWVRMRERRAALSILAFTPAIFLIWLAHAMGWGLLGLMVAGYEAERLWRLRAEPLWPRLRDLLIRGLPFLLPLALTLVWSGGQAGPLFSYGDGLLKRKLLNLVVVLRGTTPLLDIGIPLLLAAALGLLLWQRQVRIDARAAAAGLMILAASLLMPTTLFGSWGADERIVPYAAILLALAFRWTGSVRAATCLVVVAASLFCLRTAAIATDWHRLDQAYASHLSALDLVPPGARIHAVVLQDGCHGRWRATAYAHLPSMAIVRRDALVNTQWLLPGAALLRVSYPLPETMRNDPSQFVDGYDRDGRTPAPLLTRVAELPRDRLDFLWVLETHGEAPVLRGLPPPVFTDDNSALYPLR